MSINPSYVFSLLTQLQNSANIIVQNRLTGQLEEEKMQVYVRLGIRLLYKVRLYSFLTVFYNAHRKCRELLVEWKVVEVSINLSFGYTGSDLPTSSPSPEVDVNQAGCQIRFAILR